RGVYGEGLRILGALVELLPAGDRRWVEVANAFSGRAEWVFDHRADADFSAAIDALRAIDAHLEGSGDLLQRASIKSRLTSFLAWGTGQLDQAAEAAAEGSPYRITWNVMSLGWSLGIEGRLDEALRCFAEAKEANPAWREGNVLELESHVRWLAGDLAGALRCTQDSLSLSPGMSSRRRGMAMFMAALATAEIGEIDETRRHVASARRVHGD